MRCYICDVELGTLEIQLDEELKSEPCTTCTKIIMDTAYSEGFTPGGNEDIELLDDEEIEEIQEDVIFHLTT